MQMEPAKLTQRKAHLRVLPGGDAMQPDTPPANDNLRRVEWLLIAAVVGILATAAVPGYRSYDENSRIQSTLQGVESLLLMARDEAIRTNEEHWVYFSADPAGTSPTGSGSDHAPMVLLMRGAGSHSESGSEGYVASVPFQGGDAVAWGSNRAQVPAPGDLARELAESWSFLEPDGSRRAMKLAFQPDGSARSVSARSSRVGSPGSGAGALYLRSPQRDYAVVLSPSGRIVRHVWNSEENAWSEFVSR